ncbi:hypothetical protein, partial [Tolypothrix sp. VBCCA 56010]|uniref:hypothetical protein n=1 Tax=Tolypothrix sp. VBCCA 56010 TaxID=3137731 RepID=UPI003D7DC30B
LAAYIASTRGIGNVQYRLRFGDRWFIDATNGTTAGAGTLLLDQQKMALNWYYDSSVTGKDLPLISGTSGPLSGGWTVDGANTNVYKRTFNVLPKWVFWSEDDPVYGPLSPVFKGKGRVLAAASGAIRTAMNGVDENAFVVETDTNTIYVRVDSTRLAAINSTVRLEVVLATGSGVKITSGVDGCRVRGIRTHGWGMESFNSQEYGIKVMTDGQNCAIVEDSVSLFGPTHAQGHYSPNGGGRCVFKNCAAGGCLSSAGACTIWVTYSLLGGNQCAFVNCTPLYGALDDGQVYTGATTVFFGHAGTGSPVVYVNFAMTYGCKVRRDLPSASPVIMANFDVDTPSDPLDPAACRNMIVNCVHDGGSTAQWAAPQKGAAVNSQWREMHNPIDNAKAGNACSYHTTNAGDVAHWINCTNHVRGDKITTKLYMTFASGGAATWYWHSQNSRWRCDLKPRGQWCGIAPDTKNHTGSRWYNNRVEFSVHDVAGVPRNTWGFVNSALYAAGNVFVNCQRPAFASYYGYDQTGTPIDFASNPAVLDNRADFDDVNPDLENMGASPDLPFLAVGYDQEGRLRVNAKPTPGPIEVRTLYKETQPGGTRKVG